MNWAAIAYVTSGLTLTAFVVAVAAWVYRAKLLEKERLIKSASKDARGALVDKALEFFSVNTDGLTKEQRYHLALVQINARSKRYNLAIYLIGFLSVLLIVVAGIAVYNDKRSPEPTKLSYSDFPCRWAWVYLGKYNEVKRAWEQVYFRNDDRGETALRFPNAGEWIVLTKERHLLVDGYLNAASEEKCKNMEKVPKYYNTGNAALYETGKVAPEGSLVKVAEVEQLPPVPNPDVIFLWARIGAD